jgi:agmatine deiminase
MNRQFNQPPEWHEQEAVWTAWPYLQNEWPYITESQKEFIKFCEMISRFGKQALHIAFPSDQIFSEVQSSFDGISFIPHIMKYGDSWFRDTGPIFVTDQDGNPMSLCFSFNGWGGKYVMPGDKEVAKAIASKVGYPRVIIPMILEGGSIDVDGEGTGLTTRQCLLNPNRNPGKSQEEIEKLVMNAYGLSKLIWINEGLLNDHTDGHIDNIARFVAPGKVAVMVPSGKDDPNTDVYARIIETLEHETDAKGRKLEIIKIPSPGKIIIDDQIMPASFLNFIITNSAVIIPIYDSVYDQKAVKIIGTCFPGRVAIGIPSRFILTGGGSFHCITQQQPLFAS